ncbi:MAG: DNA/RNA nuclease SfsA [Ruminococcaceae bacterium]|nr:DNA/RNA nuclease SfsA [Oscillospiraceae bacterium]
MKYNKIQNAVFLSRPNRFIAKVRLADGTEETVHVKNTGRCRELLLPGVRIILSESDNPMRKTRFDLIAVWKEREGKLPLLINMDSQIPNDAAEEYLRKQYPAAVIRREVTHGDSRFDFYIEVGERRIFLEVKGCTLEEGGIALFPDAPTERGVKHLRHLTACLHEGYEAAVLFVIQMKGTTEFRPNDAMHKAFGDALREAHAAGVAVLAADCVVTEDSITVDSPVEVNLRA